MLRIQELEAAEEPGDAPAGEVVARARALSAILFAEGRHTDGEARLRSPVFRSLAASGLPLAPFPRRLGGEGLLDADRSRDLVAVLRWIGAGDLSVARLYEGHVNAVALVLRYGTAEQGQRFADAVRSGALSGVWNADGREPLRAERREARWLCSGGKILCSGAGILERPIATALTPEGRIMIMPEDALSARIDLSAWHPTGMRASATGSVDLSGLSFGREAQIGTADDYMRQPMFSGGAWRFCAVHLGAAERLVDLARAHLVRTDRAGDPYQKQRIAQSATAVVTARLWIEAAAAMLAAGTEPAGSIVAFVNLTRGVTERACLDVIETVQRGIGLSAFMEGHPVERIARDLATYLRQPVPDAAMSDAAGFVLGTDTPVADLWSR